MAVLNISTIEGSKWNLDKIALRQPSMKIDDDDFGTEWLKSIVIDMYETLYSTPCGVGLAAPQVGIQLRIVALDFRREAKRPLLLINPTYEPLTDRKVSGIESCLSVPNVMGTVERFEKIRVAYQDFYGNIIEKEYSGFEAKAFQHEIDHLDGILYVDKISDPSLIVSDGGLLNPKATQAFENLTTPKDKK